MVLFMPRLMFTRQNKLANRYSVNSNFYKYLYLRLKRATGTKFCLDHQRSLNIILVPQDNDSLDDPTSKLIIIIDRLEKSGLALEN